MMQNQFQIKIMKGSQVYECTPIFDYEINKTCIQNYLKSFNIQEPYTIVYVDADEDEITVQCEQDYEVARATMVQGQKHISFLVRPSLQYFQKSEFLKKSKIEGQKSSKIVISQVKKQIREENSIQPQNHLSPLIIQNQLQKSQKNEIKTEEQKNIENEVQIKKSNQCQMTLSAHALPTQNQQKENQKQIQKLSESDKIEAYPSQEKIHSSSVQQINQIKNQQEIFQEVQEHLNSKPFLETKNQEQEAKHQEQEIKPVLIEERLDSEQEPLIKESKPVKSEKQKITKKKSKSIKKDEYMTREETLKLIKHQIKKALLAQNKQLEEKEQKGPKLEKQIKKQDIQLSQNQSQICSVCQKQLKVPYYLNSYINVKICQKCQKKDKGLHPLIKIRQKFLENKVLFGVPQIVYQSDLSTFNLKQIQKSKLYNLYVTHMNQSMKAEMRKLIQEAMTYETKQKKIKNQEKVKAKKTCTSIKQTTC